MKRIKLKWGILSVVVILSLCMLGIAFAEEVPPIVEEPPPGYEDVVPAFDPEQVPGEVRGEGTHFEITDSNYLNVTLDSTELVSLAMTSHPGSINISLYNSTVNTVTQLTINGLLPNTQYYMYLNDFHNLTEILTDYAGSYSFSFDSMAHGLVIIKEEPSTYFISDAPGGGDCSFIGAWDPSTLTCTLTADVNDTIQIDSDNIVLDGNGFSTDVVFTYEHSGITVKNFAAITEKLSFFSPLRSSYVVSDITVANNGPIRYLHVEFHSQNINVIENYINYANFFSYQTRGYLFLRNTIEQMDFAWIYGATFAHNDIGYIRVYYSGGNISHNRVGELSAKGMFGNVNYNTITKVSGSTHPWSGTYFKNNNLGSNEAGSVKWSGRATFRDNYYPAFDTPEEGCVDFFNDNYQTHGHCSSYYEFPYNQHEPYPWAFPVGSAGPVSNYPPTANAGVDFSAECTSPFGASVTLDGSGSSDQDGDALTYTWTASDGTDIATGATATASLSLGTHVITLTIDDGNGETASDSVTVTVADTTPPVITITGITDGAIYEFGLVPVAGSVVTDVCSTSIQVDENLTGGDGLGLGTFTFTVTATDESGNTATLSASYTVIASEAGTSTYINDLESSGIVPAETAGNLLNMLTNAQLGGLLNRLEGLYNHLTAPGQAEADQIPLEVANTLINAVQWMIDNQ